MYILHIYIYIIISLCSVRFDLKFTLRPRDGFEQHNTSRKESFTRHKLYQLYVPELQNVSCGFYESGHIGGRSRLQHFSWVTRVNLKCNKTNISTSNSELLVFGIQRAQHLITLTSTFFCCLPRKRRVQKSQFWHRRFYNNNKKVDPATWLILKVTHIIRLTWHDLERNLGAQSQNYVRPVYIKYRLGIQITSPGQTEPIFEIPHKVLTHDT